MARLGFDKDVDWVEYKIKIPEQVDPRIERLSQLVMKRSKMKMASFKSKREIRPYLKGAMRVINEEMCIRDRSSFAVCAHRTAALP